MYLVIAHEFFHESIYFPRKFCEIREHDQTYEAPIVT